MSRYCGERDSKSTLEAAAHWKRNCLLKDGSAFTYKNLWQHEHLMALVEHFINQPDGGDGNFFEKLSGQLALTEPEVKQLAAEILWVMFLCSSNIKPDKKREGIYTIWNWSAEKLPDNVQWLEDIYLYGVGSSGTGYNTNRWRELVFAIRTIVALKELGFVEREALLNDGWAMAKWLERIPECDSRQFRHMLLFLLFPDKFERIFGGGHRRNIIMGFTGKSKAQTNQMSALEMDNEFSSIRKKKEKEYNTQELDFYVSPLKDLWGENRNVSWLMTWNPSNWKWDTYSKDRDTTHNGKKVTIRWSCSNRNPMVGDKVYLSRTGVEPKGIIATGNIIKAPYEAEHWDESKPEETCWYVDVDFTRIQDPAKGDSYITIEDLKKITIDNQHWTPQTSGIEIKQQSAGVLNKLWEQVLSDSLGEAVKSHVSVEPENLILYGPPGTGKTYQLQSLIEKYSSKKQMISREAWLIQQLLDVRWFDAIFAALYNLGKSARVKDIIGHEFVALKARAMGREKNISNTVWACLQSHTSDSSKTVKYKNKSAPYVFDKSEESVWTFVDDWQDECSEQIELAESLKRGPEKGQIQKRYEFVTFHQAYSYEDFVEGIRPVQDNETGELSYLVVPGVFQRIAKKAKVDPGQKYAIFIDEINRGNIAKIFGELITLIETDKRAVYDESGNKSDGMELTLPYSGALFGVPANLDIYGTMNTADRSIALLDTALRRRFKFKELMPDPALISGSRGDGYIEDGEGGVINLRALLDSMNRRIRFLLNRDMTLGHAYLMNVRDFSGLTDVLLNQIIPLLQEYFYEDWQRIQLVFSDIDQSDQKKEPQIICHKKMNAQDILGFDHDDFEDLYEYRIAPGDDITPDSIRKIYEVEA